MGLLTRPKIEQLATWIQNAAGAVVQNLLDELRRTVRPEHFGAKGDGVTDDTAALAAAAVAAGIGGRVTLRPGKTYLISDTITASSTTNFVEFYSGGHLDRSGKIKAAAGMNKPMFVATGTNRFKFNGVALVGSSSTGTPLTAQSCVRIETTNNVEIRNCYLGGAHNLIDIQGVSFYTRIENVYFADCTNAWINGQCAVANGFDITITQCNGTTAQQAPYGFYFDGLGSLIMSDCQFSPSHCTVAGLYVNSQATLTGPCFVSNTVFELGATGCPGLYFKGSSGAFCKWWHFTNSYFYGDAAVRIDYATKMHFTNCYYTGTGDGAGGRNAIIAYNNATDIYINNCDFEVSNVPITCDAAASALSFYIDNPRYNGGFPFVTFGGLSTPANLLKFVCTGGSIGVNANPLQLPNKLDRDAYITSQGDGFGPVRQQVYTGTFAATGIVNIPHSISNGNKRILAARAYTRGGSGQMTELTVNYIDATNVQINNATNTAVYRMTVWFVNVADSNWP